MRKKTKYIKSRKGKQKSRKMRTRRYRKGGEPKNDDDRKRKLQELQNLMRMNIENGERNEQVNDRLDVIEAMTPLERQQHAEEEQELYRELEHLAEENNRLGDRFERLKREYFAQYGMPTGIP